MSDRQQAAAERRQAGLRDRVCVYMEQAVIGPMARYDFYSQQFSSCSPLFAINLDTGVGADYHVPGKNGKDRTGDDQAVLALIADRVRPTHVWVFPHGDHASTGASSNNNAVPSFMGFPRPNSDVPALIHLLGTIKTSRGHSFSIVEGQRARRSLTVRLNNGFPQFLVGPRGPYGKSYDSRRTDPPPDCTVVNWDIDVSAWIEMLS